MNDSLDLFLVKKVDLFLKMSLSMFMSIVDSVQVIFDDCIVVLVVGNNLFTNSLIDATIQDGGKREKSDACCLLC